MKATTLISLQFTAFLTMLGTGCAIHRNCVVAIPFALALMVFICCSRYIEKHGKRLFREHNREERKKMNL